MENSDRRRRFSIFSQLSNDISELSRGLQIVCEDPEVLAPKLGKFGEVEMIQKNLHSVTVIYGCISAASAAYKALSKELRVFFLTESSMKSHRRDYSSQSADLTLSVESEESTRTSPIPPEPEDYHIDLDRIRCGADLRTTVMIKNIPNKYTREMLIQTVEQHFQELYDFLYLPIDFKNKCNVGYAFINFTSPAHVIRFYQERCGRKWEHFNSQKICKLAYAKLQGLHELTNHFESSSVMAHEDITVRPVIKKITNLTYKMGCAVLRGSSTKKKEICKTTDGGGECLKKFWGDKPDQFVLVSARERSADHVEICSSDRIVPIYYSVQGIQN